MTLFSGNPWNALWDWHHVQASSWYHISLLDIIFFPLFINSEELIYFQISEVPYLNSQTQFIITFTIEVCIVISGLTFEWGMLFRSEIQWCYRDFTRQTVRLLRWSACRWWLGHFNRINFGGSATAGIRAETYTLEVTMNLKTHFEIKKCAQQNVYKITLDSLRIVIRS